MKSIILVMLLLLSFDAVGQLTDDELDRLDAFDVWIHQAFQPHSLETVQGIRSLGRLVDETTYDHSVAHVSPGYQMREFVFDGLMIYAVVEEGAPSRVWVTTIEITSASWPLESGLAVGQRITELERLSVDPEEGLLRFCGVNNCLIAEERDGFIGSLRLEIYVD